MRIYERGLQVWSVLALAAKNRQVLTYKIVGKLVGVPPQGLGQVLEPIQSYCLLHKLPPLTILVVSETTGEPSAGFIAAQDISRAQLEVFAFDWLAHGAPSAEALSQALEELPSNGVLSAAVEAS